MTTTATGRIRNRQPVGHMFEDPGFRRRHRMLTLVLALHLPALAGLAVLTGGSPQDVLIEASAVVLALTAGAFLNLSPRLRAGALTVGLLGCAVVTGLLTATVVWGLLHGGIVGLLAAAHLGSSWRAPRSSIDTEHDDLEPATDDANWHTGTDTTPDSQPGAPRTEAVGVAAPEVEEGYIEVREVYTGVWSAKHLVRPQTRLVRMSDPSHDVEAAPTADPTHVDAMNSGGTSQGGHLADGARHEDAHAGPGQAPLAPPLDEPRDPNLTREVLEALHLSATEETFEAPRDRVASGHAH